MANTPSILSESHGKKSLPVDILPSCLLKKQRSPTAAKCNASEWDSVYYSFTKRVEVRKTTRGYQGLFALEDIKKGDNIWTNRTALHPEIEEVLVTREEIESWPQERRDFFLSYCWQDESNLFCGHATLEQVKRNAHNYWNHSCDPNTWFLTDTQMIARRDINAGEELTYDYCMSDTTFITIDKCDCGTAVCRGTIRPDDYTRPELQQRYGNHFRFFILQLLEASRCSTSAAAAVSSSPLASPTASPATSPAKDTLTNISIIVSSPATTEATEGSNICTSGSDTDSRGSTPEPLSPVSMGSRVSAVSSSSALFDPSSPMPLLSHSIASSFASSSLSSSFSLTHSASDVSLSSLSSLDSRIALGHGHSGHTGHGSSLLLLSSPSPSPSPSPATVPMSAAVTAVSLLSLVDPKESSKDKQQCIVLSTGTTCASSAGAAGLPLPLSMPRTEECRQPEPEVDIDQLRSAAEHAEMLLMDARAEKKCSKENEEADWHGGKKKRKGGRRGIGRFSALDYRACVNRSKIEGRGIFATTSMACGTSVWDAGDADADEPAIPQCTYLDQLRHLVSTGVQSTTVIVTTSRGGSTAEAAAASAATPMHGAPVTPVHVYPPLDGRELVKPSRAGETVVVRAGCVELATVRYQRVGEDGVVYGPASLEAVERNAKYFFNHSCDPNLQYVNGDFVTARDIQPHEELTIDYDALPVSSGLTPLLGVPVGGCNCGAALCRRETAWRGMNLCHQIDMLGLGQHKMLSG